MPTSTCRRRPCSRKLARSADLPVSCSTTLLVRRWAEPVAAGSKTRFKVSSTELLAHHWPDKTDWEVGNTVRALGFDAECVEGGRAGPHEPKWPQRLDAPVTDGSIAWRIVAPGSSSLRTTATGFDWAPPDSISLSGQVNDTLESTAFLEVASDAAPGEYTVMVTITCANGEIYKRPCILVVE